MYKTLLKISLCGLLFAGNLKATIEDFPNTLINPKRACLLLETTQTPNYAKALVMRAIALSLFLHPTSKIIDKKISENLGNVIAGPKPSFPQYINATDYDPSKTKLKLNRRPFATMTDQFATEEKSNAEIEEERKDYNDERVRNGGTPLEKAIINHYTQKVAFYEGVGKTIDNVIESSVGIIKNVIIVYCAYQVLQEVQKFPFEKWGETLIINPFKKVFSHIKGTK